MKSSRARNKVASEPVSGPSGEDRLSQIAMAAYYKAEARGFEPGCELNDWLVAEKELEDMMSAEIEAESC